MISAALVLAFAPPQTVYTTVEGAAVGAPMWSLAGAADPHAPHVLSFFLKQRNTAALKAALDGVSDPASPDYGKHWSLAAVTALVRPSDAAIDAVVAWLAAEGLRGELSPTGEVLHVRCTLGNVHKRGKLASCSQTNARRHRVSKRAAHGGKLAVEERSLHLRSRF